MGLLGGLVGGIIGGIFAGPWGGIIGAVVGHKLTGSSSLLDDADAQAQHTQMLTLLMKALGKLAKSDGRVSADEAQFVSRLIKEFGENDQELRTKLKQAFDSGKSTDVDFADCVRQLDQMLNHEAKLTMMEIFCTLARIDDRLDPAEEKLLLQAERILGTTGFVRNFFRAGSGEQRAETPPPPPPRDELADAYQKLGCKPSDSDDAIKKAWRKKTMEFHPDKVMGKGLSEEYIAYAEKQMKEINLAYETIKKARSIS